MPDKVEKVNFGQIGPPPTSVPSLAIANDLLVNVFRAPRPVGHQHLTLHSPSPLHKNLLNPTSPPLGWPTCPKFSQMVGWLVG